MRWTCRRTHQGAFQGVPPTGREIELSGITIFRVVNGKLLEGWNYPNLLSVIQQIGAVPAAGQN